MDRVLVKLPFYSAQECFEAKEISMQYTILVSLVSNLPVITTI